MLKEYIKRVRGMTYAGNHPGIVDMKRIDLKKLDEYEQKLKSPAVRGMHCKRVWEQYYTNEKAHKWNSEVSPMCACQMAHETYMRFLLRHFSVQNLLGAPV